MLTSIVENKIHELNNNIIYAGEKFRPETKEIIFEALLNLFPVNFSWCDLDGYMLGCNKNELTFFNAHGKDEIIGKRISEIASKEACKNTKKVLKTGISLVAEEHHTDKNGNITYFISIKSPIKVNNQIVGAACIGVDITERKMMEQALQLANQTKNEFLANMRHDLRTPFTGILSVAQLLGEQETDPVKKEYLKDIEDCSESLLEHLNDILEYIKMESGSFAIVEKEFDIADILNDVYKMMLPSLVSKDIKFELIVENPIPYKLIGDARRLQRILMNIVSNSIKFTEKGHINIYFTWDAISDEKYIIKFSIEDTGIGIPEDKKEAIFEKFSRLIPSYNGTHTGKGLGLTIVKKFLEDIGGQYRIESTLNKGTTFEIAVPFKASLFSMSKNSDVRKRNILLVEHSAVTAKVQKQLLEESDGLNCRVDIAKSGAEALKMVTKKPYDLILMDIWIPDMKGYDLVKKIRSHEEKNIANIKIVAITAHVSDEAEQEYFDSGINEIMLKSLNRDTIEKFKHYLSFMEN